MTILELKRISHVVSVQLPDVRAVRGSFKKFQRACCPSGAETDVGYITQVQESEWLQQVGIVTQ